ncbi:MAG: DUF3800 domain-containing protein [Candidatus Omnitrophica bacterium]|nr:DUF3800 domain-containing protein [Candidatus Omnitrophota bacterium]
MYIYLDESGDLGFNFKKKGTSKHFLITVLLTREPKKIANCIKHLKEDALQKKYKKIPEIKFNNSPEVFRKRVLRKLSQQEIFIFAFCLNKIKVVSKLHDKKDKVYNYIAGLLFDKILNTVNPGEDLIMTVDKVKVGKIQIEDFNFYLELKLFLAGQAKRKLEVIHVDSQKNRCIQAVDFISGSIFRKYEFQSLGFYNLIKSKIVNELFWPK